jgi:glucose/arabinose dehydrogenase
MNAASFWLSSTAPRRIAPRLMPFVALSLLACLLLLGSTSGTATRAETFAAAALRAPIETGAAAPASYRTGHLRLRLTKFSSGFHSPLFLTSGNDGSKRLFVVEQAGQIKTINNGVRLRTPFLDIRGRVGCCGERGLLGLAFHPSYRTNGLFYVDYTDKNGNTVIAEYHRSSSSPSRASTAERVLLRINQPFPNHNGGMLAFGPDGFLYIGMGDGGGRGDPGNNAQNSSSRLGKILRIDVNGRTGGLPYGIPGSNPLVGQPGDDLIWSLGLRNPWRFSFDRSTGDLWIGDVGEERHEEIDRATRASGGGRGRNFGWRIMEGRACYLPSSGCNTSGMTSPLTTYPHSLGCSVTGGYVYRGTQYPAMAGAYLFADFCTGRIWAVVARGSSSQTRSLLLNTSHRISSFGQGPRGGLYLTDLSSGDVFKLSGTSR